MPDASFTFTASGQSVDPLSIPNQISGLQADVLNLEAELKLTNQFTEPDKWRRLTEAVASRKSQIQFLMNTPDGRQTFGPPATITNQTNRIVSFLKNPYVIAIGAVLITVAAVRLYEHKKKRK